MSGRARLALAVLACLATGPVVAQGQDWAGLDATQTARVAEDLRDGLSRCAKVPEVFVHDCVRATARHAARKLSNNAAYWEVEVALTRISRRLDQWVRSVEDPAGARLSHDGTRLRAVSATAIPELDALTLALIEEARVNILNAAPGELPFFLPIASALETLR